MLPPYDTGATLQRLGVTLAELRPQRVISLGDSLHDPEAARRMPGQDRRRLEAMVAEHDWLWIEGNHDGGAPEAFGGERSLRRTVGPLTFVHEPSPDAPAGEVAGHLHPCCRVAGRAGSVRRRCFITDGRRLILPAYGALAGGLNVLDGVFEPLFPQGFRVAVVGREEVFLAGRNVLSGDRGRGRRMTAPKD
jgi:hypothetical protein